MVTVVQLALLLVASVILDVLVAYGFCCLLAGPDRRRRRAQWRRYTDDPETCPCDGHVRLRDLAAFDREFPPERRA